jgi:rhamnosyltransferase
MDMKVGAAPFLAPRGQGVESKVYAVIVTYNPNPVEVALLIERIRDSVQQIVIVDNGSRNHDAIAELEAEDVEVRFLECNLGVATAQNVGIEEAMKSDCKFVILFDQDSLPDANMIPRLLRAHQTLSAQGVRVAALGANWRDRNNGTRRRGLSSERPFIKEQMLISSGCLIPIEALHDVGLMMDELFIDHIDAEWCMRATRKHREHGKRMETDRCWKVFIVCDAHMGHSLGTGAVQLGSGLAGALGGLLGVFGGFFGVLAGGHIGPVDAMLYGVLGASLGGGIALLTRREFHWASPVRLYYGFRNSLYLWLRSDFPLRWKLQDAMYRAMQVALVCAGVYPANRFGLLKLVLRGVWHGVIGRMGPMGSMRPHAHPVHGVVKAAGAFDLVAQASHGGKSDAPGEHA